jgi:hypothetical protein
LAVGGLSLEGLRRARMAGATETRQSKSVIMFWMAGGPSHIDTYDMKPDAAAEVRGPFRPIRTKQAGLDVCELLPRQAAVGDKLAIVRSITHDLAVHDDGSHWMQTGYPLFMAREKGQTHPAQGAIVSRLRGANQPGMPAYVCIPEDYQSHLGFYQTAAYLGSRNDALAGGDPSLGNYRPPTFQPPPSSRCRAGDRQGLAPRSPGSRAESAAGFGDLDAAQQQALELTTGSRARQAFDLSQEPEKLRDRYGRHAYGQGALLARRLVEAGTTFVTINLYEKDVDWWDDHYTIEANLRKRLPQYDAAVATLIEDLSERGLLDNTLVAAFGEFGRGPRIDKGAGRGHWPSAMSVLLAGGGIRGGQIVGSTLADGSKPQDRHLAPGDLLATIYHVLGIDHQATLPDLQNRPIPWSPPAADQGTLRVATPVAGFSNNNPVAGIGYRSTATPTRYSPIGVGRTKLRLDARIGPSGVLNVLRLHNSAERA